MHVAWQIFLVPSRLNPDHSSHRISCSCPSVKCKHLLSWLLWCVMTKRLLDSIGGSIILLRRTRGMPNRSLLLTKVPILDSGHRLAPWHTSAAVSTDYSVHSPCRFNPNKVNVYSLLSKVCLFMTFALLAPFSSTINIRQARQSFLALADGAKPGRW
jgi:hypothetical protein